MPTAKDSTSSTKSRREEPTVPFRLVVESEENRGMIFPLRERMISIGRGPQNTIQIIDARMSRIHARLDREETGWVVRNLQSKNGILVNDRPVLDTVRMNPGDTLHVGNTVFMFEPDIAKSADTSGSDSAVKLVDDDRNELETSQIMELPADDDDKGISDTGVPATGEERLRSIYKIGKLIQSILDQDELLNKVMAIVCQVLQPAQACIMLYDRKHQVLVPRVVHRPPGTQTEILISGSIIHQAMEDRVAVLMSDGQKDERFKKSDSVVAQQIRSAICVPLVAKDEVLGALYLDTRGGSRQYTDGDLQWAAGVAGQASMAIAISMLHSENIAKHEQEREIQIARNIQMNLLPKSMPKIKGFEFGGMSEPAKKVGGDYYDIISLEDGTIAMTIADVSGKGVAAALLLASFRAAFRMEARTMKPDNLIEIVERLNETVCQESTNNMFIAAVLAHFNPETRVMTFCNAGHGYPLLRLTDGTVKELEAGGSFLGIMPGMIFESDTVEIPPKSILVFTTDGIIDAMNPKGDAFGSERQLDFIQAFSDQPAQDFCNRLYDEVKKYQGDSEQFDDVTVMALRAL